VLRETDILLTLHSRKENGKKNPKPIEENKDQVMTIR
jgi:hypothetical protein